MPISDELWADILAYCKKRSFFLVLHHEGRRQPALVPAMRYRMQPNLKGLAAMGRAP